MEYDSIDDILEQFLPEDELKEVNRILYGNQRNPRYVLCQFALKCSQCDETSFLFNFNAFL